MHAEIDALKHLAYLVKSGKIKKNTNTKMDMVVLRVSKSGKLGESAPCLHCTNELKKNSMVRINNLYFSNNDGTISCMKFDAWTESGTNHVSKGWKWKNDCGYKN